MREVLSGYVHDMIIYNYVLTVRTNEGRHGLCDIGCLQNFAKFSEVRTL